MAIIPSNMRKVESALDDLRSCEVLIRRGERRAAFTGPNGSSKLTTFGQLIGQEIDQRRTRMR
jgi:Fe-S cluster assembly ATPase SufC